MAGTVPVSWFALKSRCVNRDSWDSVLGIVPHNRLPCKSREVSDGIDASVVQSLPTYAFEAMERNLAT